MFSEDRLQFRKMRHVLDMDGGDGCTTVWMFLMLLNGVLQSG